MSGHSWSEITTRSSTTYDSDVSFALLNSKFTPSKMSFFLFGSKSAFLIGQPFESTSAPRGVFGHSSMPSQTPSPSESWGQPRESTYAPFGVFGQSSLASGTPSPSESRP